MSVTRADLHCIACGRPSIGIRCISCVNGFVTPADVPLRGVLLDVLCGVIVGTISLYIIDMVSFMGAL